MTQIPCPAHTLSHSLLQSLSDLFSHCSALFMFTSWSKTKLTPHCAPCLTKAPLPVVWGPPKGGSGGLFLTYPPRGSNSDHQQQPPVALGSLKRSHNFYLYVRLSTIPSTCIILLHLCGLRFHAIFFPSNPAISLKSYIIYKYHLSHPLSSLTIILFNLSNSVYILPCIIMIFVFG